ncbi:MAG TPA: hypothetical protein DCQ16_05805 [Spirochaetaceae bacterium]|nr:hypothetical protein [Spirochaetaceae bacterium]
MQGIPASDKNPQSIPCSRSSSKEGNSDSPLCSFRTRSLRLRRDWASLNRDKRRRALRSDSTMKESREA